MKRGIPLLLILCLLVGCGQETATSAQGPSFTNDADSTTQVLADSVQEDDSIPPYYVVEYSAAGEAYAQSRSRIWYNDRFLCTKASGDNDSYARSLYWAGPYDDEGQELALPLTGNEAILGYCIGNNDTIGVLISDVIEDANEGPEGIIMDGYGSSRLVCMDLEGEILWETSLPQSEGSLYSNIAITADGAVYVIRCEYSAETGFFSDHYLEQVDRDGTVTASMSCQDVLGASSGFSGLHITPEGTLLLEAQADGWPCLYSFDLEAGTLSEPYFTTTSDMMWPTISTGQYADFYVLDENTGLTAYTLDGETHSYFKLTDLPSTVPESAFLVAVTEEYGWLFQVVLSNNVYFAKVTGQWDPPPESEKISLTLGTSNKYLSFVDLSELVVAFNILYPDYELVLRDYSQDGILSIEEKRTQLNEDILNGQGPDILATDSDCFPCGTYAGNGFLADLYPLMEADPEFQISDYYENILHSCQIDEQLYGWVMTFSMTSVITNGDYVDVSEGWTPTQCQAIAAESDIPLLEGLPEGLSYTDRDLASYLLGDGLQYYINGDTCDFTSGEFAAMLELLAADYPRFEDAETIEESLHLKNGQVLMEYVYLHDASTLFSMQWKYGSHYALTGVPSPARARLQITPACTLGISQQTTAPEACWNFLKMVQVSINSRLSAGWGLGFSTHRGTMEEIMRRVTLPVDDPDFLGTTISFGSDVDTVDLEPASLSQAEADTLLELIESTPCAFVDAEIRNIVQEEVASFFSGDKTAQQVAEIIQNRVQLHLWEQS